MTKGGKVVKQIIRIPEGITGKDDHKRTLRFLKCCEVTMNHWITSVIEMAKLANHEKCYGKTLNGMWRWKSHIHG